LITGIGSFWYFLCVAFYGFPVVFTTSTTLITWTTILAAIFEFVGGAFFWVAVSYVYAAKNTLIRRTIIVATSLVTLAGAYLAVRDVLAEPVKIIEMAGEYILYSPVSREYSILIAIQYLSCILMGIAFWRQGSSAQYARDKWRLRILSGTLLVVGVVLGLLPFTQEGMGILTKEQSLQLTAGFVLLAIFLAITLFIKPQKQAK
jgi:hypothetical protein